MTLCISIEIVNKKQYRVMYAFKQQIMIFDFSSNTQKNKTKKPNNFGLHDGFFL